MKEVMLPLTPETISSLRVGEEVLLSGVVYTARDRVHQMLVQEYEAAKAAGRTPAFPFPFAGQTIYYCGPTPAPPGRVIGAAGPTTSSRMDRYTPTLLSCGLKGMLGKGGRDFKVIEAIKRFGAVYFITYGGCGALLATHIKEAKVVAYPELGAEAVWRFWLVDFPAVVGVDSSGAVLPSLRSL